MSKASKTKKIAVAGVVSGTALFAGIGSAYGVDAPTSASKAVGVEVSDIVTVSGTEARAASDTGSADADVVKVLGSTVIGGSQRGAGSASDVLLDTGETPLGRVEVAPWATAVTQTATSRHSESDSAVARLSIIDPDTVFVGVLESHSVADHTSARSTSHATSDGARVIVGGPSGVRITVLHSEMDSSGKGSTSPLGVNDTWVLSQSTTSSCVLDVTPLLGIGCLSAVGGLGEVTASVLGVNVADTITGQGVAATARGGEGQAAVLPADVTRDSGGFDGDSLPRTGRELGFLASLAAALISAGALFRRIAIPATVRSSR